jgi:hypothetical protein
MSEIVLEDLTKRFGDVTAVVCWNRMKGGSSSMVSL